MKISTDKRKYFFALIVIFGLGFVLRVYNLDAYSIWVDEKISVCIANGVNLNDPLTISTITQKEIIQKNTVENVAKATIADNGNSIAYNIMLHGWTKIFGNKDWSIRFFSVIASIGLLFAVFGFTQDFLQSKQVLLVGLLLIAFHALLIAYSHQARAYSWATLFSFFSSWFLMKIFLIEKKPSGILFNYVGYIIFGALSLLTHYLTICVFLAHAAIIFFFTKRSKAWIFFSMAGVAIGSLILVWFYFGALDGYKILNSQNERYAQEATNFKLGENTFVMPVSLKHIITGIMQVWLQLFGNMMQIMNIRIREVAVTLLLPLSVIGIAFWRSKDSDVKKKILILSTLTFTQTFFAILLAIKSGHGLSFQPLYSIFVVPYAMILLAYSFGILFKGEKKIKFFGYGAFAIWLIIICISWYPVLADRVMGKKSRESNPYIKLANMANRYYLKGDTLVAPLPRDIYLLNLYLARNKEILQKTDNTIADKVYLIRHQQKDTVILMDLEKVQY